MLMMHRHQNRLKYNIILNNTRLLYHTIINNSKKHDNNNSKYNLNDMTINTNKTIQTRRNNISLSAKIGLCTAVGINLGVVFGSAIPAVIGRGAPYLPTLRKTLDIVFNIALPKHLTHNNDNNNNNIQVVDLGSGDGRVVIEAAKRGYSAIGYEINPILVLYSKMKWFLLSYHYSFMKNTTNNEEKIQGNATFYCYNIWSIKTLKDANVIFVYGLYPIMKELSSKLWNEGNDDVLVISYVFEMDSLTWTKIFDMDGVRIYKKKI